LAEGRDPGSTKDGEILTWLITPLS